MSQGELGSRCAITFQQIQKYEKGANRVSSSRLQQIAGILNVPLSFFFEGAPSIAPVGSRPAKGDLLGAPDLIGSFFTLSQAKEIAEACATLNTEERHVVLVVARALAGTPKAKRRAA